MALIFYNSTWTNGAVPKDMVSCALNVDKWAVIGAISKQPIIPGETLIILDELQELHKGLSSLKNFCENAPEYHVAVAGSLLGLKMGLIKS